MLSVLAFPNQRYLLREITRALRNLCEGLCFVLRQGQNPGQVTLNSTFSVDIKYQENLISWLRNIEQNQ